ncbi:MAG: GTP-binding protein [bacterium]|nr:GTP-binding protein [bacterium]
MEINVESNRAPSGDVCVFLYNNPIEFPPIEILKHGKAVTKSYFASLEGANQPLNEVKVLLVGDGGSGKTSLVNQFMGRDFDPSEPQTHGINIDKCRVGHADHDSPVTLNLWDFGGQQIMHATHQFFLSHRSIYILLLDGRKDEEPEYWLKHIESFGASSPILVVINKVDQGHHFDLNRKFLRQKYAGIVDFHRISCKDGTGVAELKTSVNETLNRVKIIRTVWPVPWFNVKQRLEKTARHYISYGEYERICIEEDIAEADVWNVLLDYLNDIGVNLHFKELDLRDTHVLEPRWVTEAVYKIINAPILARNNGELRLDRLSEILAKQREGDFEYPMDKHRYIIALMKKFELCYSLDDDGNGNGSGDRILVPDLLQKEEPEFEFDTGEALEFIIQYDFLPRSVMPRFIVQMHRDIKAGLQWRTGVVLEDRGFGCVAVVRADNRDRKISIRVSGAQRRFYLAALMSRLRGINQSFEKLKTEERVPMPDNKEITAPYKQLIQFEQKGIDIYLTGETDKEYDVKELLGAIAEKETTEAKILALLERLVEDGESKESAMKKLNNAFAFKPKILGLEIDVNHIFDLFLERKKK